MTTDHPRTIHGKMIVARKDGPSTTGGDLFTNTYLGRFVSETPDYWAKLHEMIYGNGRLKKFAAIIEDIVEKFSFLALARDQVYDSERRSDHDKRFFVKYHTYNFIFMTKSFLDSCAVFLNESYELGSRGNSIALENRQLLERLEKLNPKLAQQLDKRAFCFKRVVRYRNNLIHRYGLYVGAIPKVPESMTDPYEIDRYILEQPAYIPNDPDFVVDKVYEGVEGEFILVSALVDDWISAAFEVFNLILSSFTLSFEVYDPNES